jgi:hypothetical protein
MGEKEPCDSHVTLKDRDFTEPLDQKILNLIPNCTIEDYNVICTPDECIASIERFLNAGNDHFALGLATFMDWKAILLVYLDKIIPYVNEMG